VVRSRLQPIRMTFHATFNGIRSFNARNIERAPESDQMTNARKRLPPPNREKHR
jgi:hypothetical protein